MTDSEGAPRTTWYERLGWYREEMQLMVGCGLGLLLGLALVGWIVWRVLR